MSHFIDYFYNILLRLHIHPDMHNGPTLVMSVRDDFVTAETRRVI